MKHTLYIITILFIFQACSVLKQPEAVPEIKEIPENELSEAITNSANTIVQHEVISQFMLQNNARPTIITSNVTNKSGAITNIAKIYENIDMALIQTGQARVLKSNEAQRVEKPQQLAKAVSIDFALSASIEEIRRNNTIHYIFTLSLWNENSSKPIVTIEKQIE